MADDLRAYARAAAIRNGYDPDAFVRQIDQESGFNPDAHNPSGADGIAQIVPRFHPGVNTRDPRASLDYAAQLMADYVRRFGDAAHALAAYNWGPGNVGGGTWDGAYHEPWDGRRETLPGETQRYLAVILGADWDQKAATPVSLTFNPDAPVDIQTDDWSCSEQSAQWLLRSIGRNPGDAWIRGQLLDNGLVTREYGLMDASGASLAAWLQREYGDEMGLTFTSKNGASWADLMALAGTQPLMIGGRTWNHWSGVRGMQNGGLQLANPAPTWKDVGLILDRDEFDRYGAWSYITVAPTVAATPPAPPPAEDDRDARLEALFDQIRELYRAPRS